MRHNFVIYVILNIFNKYNMMTQLIYHIATLSGHVTSTESDYNIMAYHTCCQHTGDKPITVQTVSVHLVWKLTSIHIIRYIMKSGVFQQKGDVCIIM